jgi:hypothetical protein
MAISYSAIRTNIWDVVYTYIKTTNAISTNHIYSSLNSQLMNSVGYPFVILYPPNIEIRKTTITGELLEAEISILIECLHTSSESCKSLADSVVSKLLAGRDTWAGNRLGRMAIEGSDNDSWEDGQKKIHRISFTVSWRFIENRP